MTNIKLPFFLPNTIKTEKTDEVTVFSHFTFNILGLWAHVKGAYQVSFRLLQNLSLVFAGMDHPWHKASQAGFPGKPTEAEMTT